MEDRKRLETSVALSARSQHNRCMRWDPPEDLAVLQAAAPACVIYQVRAAN